MDPSQINPDDVLGLVQQVVSAAQSKNWMLLCPLLALASVSAFRLWIVPRVNALAWFTTDRGGAMLGLVAALVQAIVSAVLLPGPHSLGQVLVGALAILLGSQLAFGYLKKILGPDGNARAQEVQVRAAAVGTSAAGSSSAAADAINAALKR